MPDTGYTKEELDWIFTNLANVNHKHQVRDVLGLESWLNERFLRLDANESIFGITSNEDSVAQFVALDTTYTVTGSEAIGKRFWNQAKGTTTLITSANTALDDGLEVRYYVKASGDITNGQIVQFAGQQGDHILVKVAVPAEIIANPMLLMGLATEDIANGTFGNVTKFGEVTMNTTGWSAEDLLWWDNSTGQLTNVEPNAPDRRILVAVVQKEESAAPAADGVVLIRISWGYKIEELENVNGTTPTQGSLLVFDGGNNYWDANNIIAVPTTTKEAVVFKTTDDDTTKNLNEWRDSNDAVLAYIDATGRHAGPGTFGGIHVHDNSTAQSIPTGTTYTKLTHFSDNDPASNVTPDAANDKITFTKTGYYLVNCSLNFSDDTNNVEWRVAPFLNGVEYDSIHIVRKIGTAGDVGSASFSGIIDVTTAGWDLDVRARHNYGSDVDLTVEYSNLSVIYLGET